MLKSRLNVVVAASSNMGIGIEGRLPWRLKKDMAFFKQITLQTKDREKQNMIIMGRKTWFSIPVRFRPLPGRLNVILSSQLTEADLPEGVKVVRSLDEAIDLQDSSNIESVFVIGGASVYKEAVEGTYPCRIYMTKVQGEFECDTFFTYIDESIFKRVPSEANVPVGVFEEGGIQFSYEVYEKQI